MAEELAGGKLLLDEPAEAVARLRINNPAKRNALDHDILDGLAEVLPRLDHGIETRCVVITGAEAHFSAGYDISALSGQSLERGSPSHHFNVVPVPCVQTRDISDCDIVLVTLNQLNVISCLDLTLALH